MITVYRSTPQGVAQISEPADGSWIHMVNPDLEELERVQHAYNIPPDYLTYPLDQDEMARTEKDEGVTLIILRVPRYQGETSDIPYTTVPLGIIQTDRAIVTVCSFESDLIRGLTNGRVRNLSTTKRNRFLLHIFLVAAQQYLTYLRSINKTVDVLEDKLQLSTRNREVLELLKYQKSLTYFTTALKANELMMARLQKSQLFRMYPDDEDLLEDALTEIGQAIEMTNISSGILSAMMDAFASIISNNLNVVMKFLASVTIILALPTLVASIYGMNVDLPLDSHPLAFYYVLAAALIVSIVVVVVFIRRDWL
ncbi:MAG: magnesium transporter CorA family protein [Chloroflexi bacterium]|nr:magnesium transporter CorA family protein [Chloroflexota bacterium]